MSSGDAMILAFVVLPIALVLIVGIWRATARGDGSGCPCCDQHLDATDHRAHEQDEETAKKNDRRN